jgi:DMSO/TMAO reductase YedYZ molybdopterin-dependent catalytic subunit
LLLPTLAPAAEPENISYPLSLLNDSITPANRFFVRDHFSPPEVSLSNWTLSIEGAVANSYSLTFSDLLESPSGNMEAVLECAGNLATGAAVSNGVWEGVPLASLIEASKPQSDASVVLLEGADGGALLEHHPVLPYRRIVPLTKCLRPESLVAFRLNGQMLPTQNGFPARALFPGWYGMNSVKWLRRIVVLNQSAASAFDQSASGMDRLYMRVEGSGDSVHRTALTQTKVKSNIAWPGNGNRLPTGRHQVWGFAWSGAGRVREVSISTDGGETWSSAQLGAQKSRYSWTRWGYEWNATPGEHVILSRARDEAGIQQPLTREPERKDQYELNWCAPIHCSVR